MSNFRSLPIWLQLINSLGLIYQCHGQFPMENDRLFVGILRSDIQNYIEAEFNEGIFINYAVLVHDVTKTNPP